MSLLTVTNLKKIIVSFTLIRRIVIAKTDAILHNLKQYFKFEKNKL